MSVLDEKEAATVHLGAALERWPMVLTHVDCGQQGGSQGPSQVSSLPPVVFTPCIAAGPPQWTGNKSLLRGA